MISSTLSMVLGVWVFALLVLLAVVVVNSWLAFLEEEHAASAALVASVTRPLPFHPPSSAPGFEPTHSGGLCPNGAAAPKTSRPGSLSHRLSVRQVAA